MAITGCARTGAGRAPDRPQRDQRHEQRPRHDRDPRQVRRVRSLQRLRQDAEAEQAGCQQAPWPRRA